MQSLGCCWEKIKIVHEWRANSLSIFRLHNDLWILLFIQVVAVRYNLVKPRSADVNENVLSEVARNQFGLNEDQVKNGQPLENVLEEVR